MTPVSSSERIPGFFRIDSGNGEHADIVQKGRQPERLQILLGMIQAPADLQGIDHRVDGVRCREVLLVTERVV